MSDEKLNKSFYSCDNPSHEGKSNTWFTPIEYISHFGEFDLDPCTESFRPFDTAKNHICHDLNECGLSENWYGKVWLNPPYGRDIGKWLEKLALHKNGIALVFARCETKWAQDAFKKCDAVFFLKGRISFIPSSGKNSTNAANGSMFLVYGKNNVKAIKNIGLIGTMMILQ